MVLRCVKTFQDCLLHVNSVLAFFFFFKHTALQINTVPPPPPKKGGIYWHRINRYMLKDRNVPPVTDRIVDTQLIEGILYNLMGRSFGKKGLETASSRGFCGVIGKPPKVG